MEDRGAPAETIALCVAEPNGTDRSASAFNDEIGWVINMDVALEPGLSLRQLRLKAVRKRDFSASVRK